MAVFTGKAGVCHWALVRGGFDDDAASTFIAHLRHVSASVQEGQLVLDLLHDIPMPTALQRRQIVDVLQSSGRLHLVRGHALVSNAAIGRGVLTAVTWVVRPPFEEKVFSNPDDAMAWMKERNPAFDPVALTESIRRAFADFERLRW